MKKASLDKFKLSLYQHKRNHGKNVDHIKDYLDILDFELTVDEMLKIAKLDRGVRYYNRIDEPLVRFANWKPTFEKN